ncbi:MULTISPECIES: UDP-2,3-diacylglucosamine diphosphatase [Methylocystis]|uniref:UDP-2,3-diacylglucosamine diphosphatase n=1 Tax=Methylocystis TaxID=133 RepID=UPI0024B89077|nr:MULTISPECIES: UDP-2,3-diacylglucosamine diphosphatase [Methylocystis]MDJ0449895.1 UDP-2,3-diacylglucosamine diphosphatase [Methylocystis sp. JR02]
MPEQNLANFRANLAVEPEPKRYRTLFLSDLHLGAKASQAHLLLDFLKHNDAETIYLVGDIVDGWKLRKGWHWPQAHNDVVQKLLRRVRKGARVIYVPGNHDEFARDYTGLTFGGVEVVHHAIHETATGKKMLIIHGDEFDIVVRNARWLALLGDWAYDAAIAANTVLNRARRLFGVGYWSFSAWAKLKVKEAVNFIGDFEETLAAEAERRGVDGVVCGHIHHATIKTINGMLYVNTGDFVESCTAIAEHEDGSFEILRWRTTAAERAAASANQPVKALPAPKAAAA